MSAPTAIVQPTHDNDAISLDDGLLLPNQAQAAQTTTNSTDTGAADPHADTESPPSPPTTMVSPALAEYSEICRDRAFETDSHMLKHVTTHAFERFINATNLELADFWLCQGSPYDHVCLARANWWEFGSCWRIGELFTRAEFHLKLYAYTLRRMCAIKILLDDGYEILEHGLTATDHAFKIIVEVMVLNWRTSLPHIKDWPERGRKRTLMTDHPRLLRAVEIVAGGGVPMRFRLRRKVPVPEWMGLIGGKSKTSDVFETAFFWFKEDGKGSWETVMDVVPKREEETICKGREYELPLNFSSETNGGVW